MFEGAELGQPVSREEFARLEPCLRNELVALQQELKRRDFPVILLFAGFEGAGRSESINLLNGWLDPHWISTHAYDDPSDEERERPPYWRFWRDLPARGRTGIFHTAWYEDVILGRAYGHLSGGALERRLDRVVTFERMLADDGAVILKYWIHLSRDAQKKRLKALAKNPLEKWRVTREDWKRWAMHDRFVEAAERAIGHTHRLHAPWLIVDGRDPHARALAVIETLRQALHGRFEGVKPAAPALPSVRSPSILAALPNDKTLDEGRYAILLELARGRLNRLQRKVRQKGLSLLLVFEGWDAAGKGGTIRRMTSALDARFVSVHGIAAPSDEERAHHYLWRFWRMLPRAGRITVFDRSWYGRVLVERVEGLASPGEWGRAYKEINDFEAQLIDHGAVLCKFWLHIDKDEQLRRFRERQSVPYKRWKITEEDWRNREKWDQYEVAVNDMVDYTSTRHAPWSLIEANDKKYCRITVYETICARVEQALKEH